MPQLDRIIIFSQIFWLFVIFTSLYVILTHFFLPKFLKSLKLRKKIIEENNSEISNLTSNVTEKQCLLKKLLLKNLTLIENSISNEFTLQHNNKLKSNIQKIDEKISIVTLNASLYCDTQLLNSISLYPKLLNLNFKSV